MLCVLFMCSLIYIKHFVLPIKYYCSSYRTQDTGCCTEVASSTWRLVKIDHMDIQPVRGHRTWESRAEQICSNKTLNQWWFTVGQPFATLDQHWTSVLRLVGNLQAIQSGNYTVERGWFITWSPAVAIGIAPEALAWQASAVTGIDIQPRNPAMPTGQWQISVGSTSATLAQHWAGTGPAPGSPAPQPRAQSAGLTTGWSCSE